MFLPKLSGFDPKMLQNRYLSFRNHIFRSFWIQKYQKIDFPENGSIHVMNSSQTKQKGVDPNSINPSFFAFRNIPNNVYIQRKLTFWRIRKSKNFLIFDAFLYPKRPKREILDFGENDRPKLNFR